MNSLAAVKELLNSNLFIVFIGLIIFDIVTGIVLAFKQKELYSKINKDGITRHFMIVTFVIFFNWIFISFKMNELGVIVISFYIGSYGLSLFENLAMLDVPFPKWLQDKFLLLREESNRGDINVTERIEK